MRLGVFGGTFDPPHVGHLIVAQDVFEALALDRLLFVPAPNPPHKRGIEVTPGEMRLRMLEAAIAGDARFQVSDLEFQRPGPSYSVDTLRELHRIEGDGQLFFILGADQLAEFASWKEPEEVARLAELVVIGRGGWEPWNVKPRIDIRYRELVVTRVDISAREIRRRVREGLSVRYMVPESVIRIIDAEGLYRPSPEPRVPSGLAGERASG